MKKILFIVSLFLNTLCSAETTEPQKIFDSVYSAYTAHAYTDSAFSYILVLDSIAKAINNTDMIGEVLITPSKEYIVRNSDKIIAYTDSIKPQLIKMQNTEYLVTAMCNLIAYYALNERFQTALNRIEELNKLLEGRETNYSKASICESMGFISQLMNESNEALNYFEAGLNYIHQEDHSKKHVYLLDISLHQDLIDVLLITKRYQESLDALTQLEDQLDNIIQQPSFDNDKYISRDCKIFVYEYRLIVYSELGNIKDAKKEFARLEQYDMESLYPIPYYYTMAVYDKALKNYSQAILKLDKALALPEGMIGSRQIVFLKQKEDIYRRMEDFRHAYQMRKTLSQLQDSIYTKSLAAQFNELRTLHHLEQLEFKEIAYKQKIKTMILSIGGFILVCILLIVIIFLIRRYSLRLKAKNKGLYYQLKEQDKLRTKLEIYEKVDEQLSGGKEYADTSNPWEQLFAPLERLMHEELLYTNPNLAREEVATRLNTNYTYLSRAIQENTGLTFSEYINSYRLESTRALIVNKQNLNITEIYTRSGFNSSSKFYKLFSERFNLTPSELRKLSKTEN